jgi:hypothetical protein
MRSTLSRAALLLAMLATSQSLAAPAEPRSIAIPSLPRAPAIDGSVKDLAAGATVKSAKVAPGKPSFVARVGVHKDVLYLWVDVADAKVVAEDAVEVSLHFAGAGATAPGYLYQFAPTGLLTPEGFPTPKFALDAVRSKVRAHPKGITVEAALPPLAIPRWPGKDPLLLDLCIRYEPHGETGEAALGNCDSGSMPTPLRLPDDYRKFFKLKVPDRATAVERVPEGWLGWGNLQLPVWINSDRDLSPGKVREFVTDHPVDPDSVHIPIPARMSTPDGRMIVPLLVGTDPYAVQEQCDAGKELRLGLYAIEGRTADRVLEWTAANCGLGRAASISLGQDGALSIGYSNGATTTFTWASDHFEQTQLGMR